MSQPVASERRRPDWMKEDSRLPMAVLQKGESLDTMSPA